MEVYIKGLEHHTINEKGEVFNLKTGKKINPSIFPIGYYVYTLFEHNKSYKKYLHRLLAEAFIPNPENKPQINHIDGNKLNNSLDNLEWVTCKENLIHAVKTGLKTYTRICNDDVVKKIYNDFMNHTDLTVLAKKYNSSLTQVSIYLNDYIDANNLREEFENEKRYQKNIRAKQNGIKKRKIRTIIMCDKNTGEEIKRFNSLIEIKQYLKVKSVGCVSNALHGKQKYSLGYFWKYDEENDLSLTSTTIPNGSTSQAIGDGSSEHPEKDEDIV